MAVRFGPPVEAELDDIWFYVARESGSTDIADRLIASITGHFFLLSKHLSWAAAATICALASEVYRPAAMSLSTASRAVMFCSCM